MHVKSYDERTLEGIGRESLATKRLEGEALGLGFADTMIRELDGATSLFYLVQIDEVTPFMPLGTNEATASASLFELAPRHITNHMDQIEDEEIEEMFDDADFDRASNVDFELTVAQQQQFEDEFSDYLIFHKRTVGTQPTEHGIH